MLHTLIPNGTSPPPTGDSMIIKRQCDKLNDNAIPYEAIVHEVLHLSVCVTHVSMCHAGVNVSLVCQYVTLGVSLSYLCMCQYVSSVRLSECNTSV